MNFDFVFDPINEFGLVSEILVWEACLLTLISGLVGVLGGFVGLALGTIRLPVLLFLGVSPALAGGTNILVSSLSSLSGALKHWKEGRVNLRVVAVMGIPAFGGAFLGGFLSNSISESILFGLAGVLVFWQGIEFLIIYKNARVSKKSDFLFGSSTLGSRGTFTPLRVFFESSIGLSIGVLGGAVGLILGSIRLPALIRILKLDPRIAAGTNLFIGFFMGALGCIGHATRGEVDYFLILLMGSTAMAGSWYGAKLSGKVNLNTLVMVIGVVLIVVGGLLVYRGYS